MTQPKGTMKLDDHSMVLLRANADGAYGYRLENWLNKGCGSPLFASGFGVKNLAGKKRGLFQIITDELRGINKNPVRKLWVR